MTTVASFLKSLEVTHEQYESIKNCPQRTTEWHDARRDRLTASRYGNALGHNPYSKGSPEDLVLSMLYPNFQSNFAMEYGTRNEPTALNRYVAHVRSEYLKSNEPTKANGFWVEDTGLLVIESCPMFGVSPDGIVHDNGKLRLLEIKCPWKYRKSDGFYETIPHMYYDQIQGIMGLLRLNGMVLHGCDFVVWTPKRTRIEHFEFDKNYFDDFMLPRLKQWYMQKYAPLRVHQMNGTLTDALSLQVIQKRLPTRKRKREPEREQSIESIISSSFTFGTAPKQSVEDVNRFIANHFQLG